MKAILLILGVISMMFVVSAQAQTTSEFGYQLHPGKLLENTEVRYKFLSHQMS